MEILQFTNLNRLHVEHSYLNSYFVPLIKCHMFSWMKNERPQQSYATMWTNTGREIQQRSLKNKEIFVNLYIIQYSKAPKFLTFDIESKGRQVATQPVSELNSVRVIYLVNGASVSIVRLKRIKPDLYSGYDFNKVAYHTSCMTTLDKNTASTWIPCVVRLVLIQM